MTPAMMSSSGRSTPRRIKYRPQEIVHDAYRHRSRREARSPNRDFSVPIHPDHCRHQHRKRSELRNAEYEQRLRVNNPGARHTADPEAQASKCRLHERGHDHSQRHATNGLPSQDDRLCAAFLSEDDARIASKSLRRHSHRAHRERPRGSPSGESAERALLTATGDRDHPRRSRASVRERSFLRALRDRRRRARAIPRRSARLPREYSASHVGGGPSPSARYERTISITCARSIEQRADGYPERHDEEQSK